MKYIKFFIVFLIANQVFSQSEIQKDSIILKGKVHYFTFIRCSKDSGMKPVKVFTCNKKELKNVKESILETYKNEGRLRSYTDLDYKNTL